MWFWLAMVFSSAAMIILTVTQIGPLAQHRRQLTAERQRLMEQALSFYGEAAVEVFTRDGREGLEGFTGRLERSTGIHLFFFEGRQEVLPQSGLSPVVWDVVARAAQGSAVSDTSGKTFLLALPLTGTGNQHYIIVGEWPKIPLGFSRSWFPFPRSFGMQLAIYLVVGGIICYGLAWHLTSPVRRLRHATRQLAAGDLTARAGEGMGRRSDEIAGLGRDFDKMAERMQALLNAQQRLLRDISHELRSPLARLNVALELARRNCGAPGAEAPLNRIEREAERLNDLIGQLLTLTLLESGMEKMEKSRVDLQSLVRGIAEDANFEARNADRSVKILSSEDVDITVGGYEEMLHRAIENIVRNGLRYTAEGTKVEITLSTLRKGGEEFALIRVRDHGPGVPQAALSLLFQPFYRVTDARDRMTGGTGIGLAITYRAVQLHQGTVTAANDPAGGLVVEIEMPCATLPTV